jgi:hypothetical protein
MAINKKLYNYILKFLREEFEEFNLDRFSRPSSPEENDDPLHAAIQQGLTKALEDPEGREILQQKREEKKDSFKEILQLNKNLLAKEKKINVDSLKLLGSGAGGTAYDIGNGLVLKVTKDASEAQSSNLIKGKKIPGIIYVQDVWQFPNSSFYGLIMEKILPFKSWPEDETKDYLDRVVDNLDLKSKLMKYKDNTTEIWKSILAEPTFSVSGDPKELQKAFQILTNIIQQVKAAGINNFFDLHLENLGKRVSNGEIVVFDLGFSDGGTEPPVLGSGSLNELKFTLRKILFN